MRKFFTLVILLTVVISFLGCFSSNEEGSENLLIQKVKTLETSKGKLFDLEITYGEFKNNIEGTFTKGFKEEYLKRLDEREVLNIQGDILTLKDLEDVSNEEFKAYQKMKEELVKEWDLVKVERKIELSNADYKGSLGMKRIYTKTTQKIYLMNQEPNETLIFKAYDFTKEDGKWKLADIKQRSFRPEVFNATERKEMLSRTAFTPENNNAIEYIESITLISE